MRILLSLLLLVPLISGCSVYMSARPDGTTSGDVIQCTTKNQLICLGAQLTTSEVKDGSLVEIYKIPKSSNSYLRSAMHGVLDISSGLAWELIGTPIELFYLGHTDYILARVTYDEMNVVQKIELM